MRRLGIHAIGALPTGYTYYMCMSHRTIFEPRQPYRSFVKFLPTFFGPMVPDLAAEKL